MDNLGYKNYSIHNDSHTLIQEIDKVEFSGNDVKSVLETISSVNPNIVTMQMITRTITLAKIPIMVPGSSVPHIIEIQMEPTQDFINEDIIKHILQTGSVETLNITFSSDKLPVTRNAMMNIIKQDDNLCKALIKKYCDITSYTLSWAKQQKPLLNLWRNTSNEIYNLLMKDIPGEDDHGFIPDDHEPTTDTILHSYVLYTQKPLPKKYHKHEANLKKISKIFSGFQGAKTTMNYLNRLDTTTQEIETNIIAAVKQGEKEIQVDTKHFYLDNGHYLYKNVLYKSPYYDYFIKNIDSITKHRDTLRPLLTGKYYGLGVGDAQKDLTLLRDIVLSGRAVFIEGSAKSLKEAEVNAYGNDHGYRGTNNHFPNDISFSQDRIDDILHKGHIIVSQSFFTSPQPREFQIADIKENYNIFSMLGGTYGNFSPEYKKQFLHNISVLMNKGDTLLLDVFKTPEDQTGINDILSHYNSPEVEMFVKNYFIKLGIPNDKIEIQLSYKNDTVHIDALVKSDSNNPTYINFNSQSIPLQGDTLFTGFQSERMNEEKMQHLLKGTGLRIERKLNDDENPFEMYVIRK